MSSLFFLFIFFLVVVAGAALFILFSRNIIHAAIALLCCFLGIAGIFVLLDAEFVGIAQIMVYIGGILILLIFGIMMTTRSSGPELPEKNRTNLGGFAFAAVVFGCLLLLIGRLHFPDSGSPERTDVIPFLGERLLTDYILPFELAGLILLLALVGAAYIAGQATEQNDTV